MKCDMCERWQAAYKVRATLYVNDPQIPPEYGTRYWCDRCIASLIRDPQHTVHYWETFNGSHG